MLCLGARGLLTPCCVSWGERVKPLIKISVQLQIGKTHSMFVTATDTQQIAIGQILYSMSLHFYHPRKQCGNAFGCVCLCVCLLVYVSVLFVLQLLKTLTQKLHFGVHHFISRMSRSDWYIKVIRSRSQEQYSMSACVVLGWSVCL